MNISKLSSSKIYELLDITETDNEEDIENVMYDSYREFVIEESIVDTSNTETGYQKQPVSASEASIQITKVDRHDSFVEEDSSDDEHLAKNVKKRRAWFKEKGRQKWASNEKTSERKETSPSKKTCQKAKADAKQTNKNGTQWK